MKTTTKIATVVIVLSPYIVAFTPNPTDSSFTEVEFAAGTGSYTIVSRDCNGGHRRASGLVSVHIRTTDWCSRRRASFRFPISFILLFERNSVAARVLSMDLQWVGRSFSEQSENVGGRRCYWRRYRRCCGRR
jgi:hypothetical protein